jgi:hypothetical protein
MLPESLAPRDLPPLVPSYDIGHKVGTGPKSEAAKAQCSRPLLRCRSTCGTGRGRRDECGRRAVKPPTRRRGTFFPLDPIGTIHAERFQSEKYRRSGLVRGLHGIAEAREGRRARARSPATAAWASRVRRSAYTTFAGVKILSPAERPSSLTSECPYAGQLNFQSGGRSLAFQGGYTMLLPFRLDASQNSISYNRCLHA